VIGKPLAVAKAMRLTPEGAVSFRFVQPYFKRVLGYSLFFLFYFFTIFPKLNPRQY
jgi:hypothetical protein